MTPSQADEASLGPEYGEPTGDGRIDGGVRIVDLGLNPEVGPTRGSWSRERSEVDDGGGTSEREELRGTDESHVGGTLVDYPNAETQPSYRVYMSKSYGRSGVRPGGTYDQVR